MRRLFLLICLLSLSNFSILSSHAQDTTTLEDARKQTIQSLIIEAYNDGNFGPADAYFGSEYIRRPGEADLNNFKGSVIALRTALPDLQATIDLIIAQGQDVAVRFNIVGTFENELVFPNAAPIPPTGQTLTLVVNTLYRFDEEVSVTEEWNGFDNLSFLAQIGAIPPPENLGDLRMGAAQQFGASPETNTAIAEDFFAAYNAGTLDGSSARFAGDFVANNPFGQLDFAGFTNDIALLRQALPDLTLTPITTVAENNWVAALYTLEGTFTVDYPLGDASIQATQDRVSLPVITFFNFNADNLIQETWELYDGWDFLTQLGLTLPEAPNPVTGQDEQGD